MPQKKLALVPVIILCGGRGERLGVLTQTRAKPAVPFCNLRIVDFQLSNCLNSGIKKIWVATQWKSQRLSIHIQEHWPSTPMLDFFVHTLPPQQMISDSEVYRGTADALYQNLPILKESNGAFTDIAILSGDHVLAMDFSQMYSFHNDKEAVFTLCAISLPVHEAASNFGVIEVNGEGRIIGFEEKPEYPKEIPGKPGFCLASMGNYFANFEILSECLHGNARDEATGHDFGKDIIPYMVSQSMPIFAYDFRENEIPEQDEVYWRDVGTIQAFFDAHMDLIRMKPALNLYNPHWPIRTPADNLPLAKFNYIFSGSEHFAVAPGSIIEGALLRHCILGRNVRAYNSSIEHSIVFDNVHIGSHCTIRNAIIDKGAVIPDNMSIGNNREMDERQGFKFDERDPDCPIVIVPRGYRYNG